MKDHSIRTLFFALTAFIIVCCSTRERLDSKTILSAKQNSEDSIGANNSQPIVENVQTRKPLKEFEILAHSLDSFGYVSDTVRIIKVNIYPELKSAEVVLFSGRPFYKIPKENTKLFWWNRLYAGNQDTLNLEAFRNGEEVWTYFYRKKNVSNVNEDGLIEQWTFKDDQAASAAIETLRSFYPLPYFNTQPYYTIHQRHLFIFHTRAMAFSYGQKKVFEAFEKICSETKAH
jgi:hypothetical protein